MLTNISNAMMLKRLSLWAFLLTTISCCLWTTGACADPGDTPEFNLEETFQGGPCMTDFSITDVGDCCYHFEDLTPMGDANCPKWEIYDPFGNLMVTTPGEVFDFCFPASGMYVVCYYDCCLLTDGTIIQDQICKDLDITCGGCVPDAVFSVTDIGDCCYHFEDLTPNPDGSNCQAWDITDASGAIVSSGFGFAFDHCFLTSGTYTICYTDCCFNPDGTFITATHCETIDVDCQCQPYDLAANPVLSAIVHIDCFITTIVISIDPIDGYCVDWIFEGITYTAIYDAAFNGHAVSFTTPCSGEYEGEVLIYCCDDPTTVVSFFIPFTMAIDCCCIPDATFSTTDLGDCCYHFEDLTPDPDGNNCSQWGITDQFGNVIVTSHFGQFIDFCFPAGTYTICYTDCCTQPDGTQVFDTHCETIQVDCSGGDCDVDALFTTTDLGDCCYHFEDLTPDPLGNNCSQWEVTDLFGNVIVTGHFGPFLDHCFPTGTYTICYTDCCTLPDGTQIFASHCETLEVDCGCTPDPLFSAEPLADCCYHFEDLTPEAGTNDPCDIWEVYDALGNVIASANGEFYDFCFPGTGTYVVCYTDCCVNADGTITSLTHCIDISVDCCTPDATFNYDTIGDCCYVFSDLTPEPDSPNDPCDKWEIYDAFGNIIVTAQGDIFNYCFVTSGSYVICHTDCCVNADGTITQDVHCIDLQVDCCTIPMFDFTWSDSSVDLCPNGGCTISFTCPALDPDLYCVVWDMGDGTIIPGAPNCPIHCYTDCGIYTVCLTVYCCNDDTQSFTVCHQVFVDCCCEVPTDIDFDWTPASDCPAGTGGCQIGFNCPQPMLDPAVYCVTWDFGDGQVANFPANICPIHCYTDCGVYTVCMTVYCCEDPSQWVTICHDVLVDCCCVVPDAISYTYFGTSGADCQAGFCLDQVLDPTKYCSTWYWGDGTQSDHPVNECPVHNYACDGIYDVCVDVYCCEDPNVRVTACQTIEVDCECNLPTNIDFNIIVSSDDCSIGTLINLPDVPCPDEICWTWNMGDGTTQVGGNVSHTYAVSGTYTVCLNVFCCDDTSIGYTVCHDVTVDCPPCTLPSFIDFDYTVDMCTVSVVGIESDDYDGNLCYSWNWGDGSPDTPGQVATHTYAASGTYIVCYTVYCCADPSVSMTVCHDITVECAGDCPEPCELHSRFLWEMFPITQADGCCMQFFDVSVPGAFTTINTWHWDFGDGNTSTIQNPLHCYDTPGSHTVCLTITGSSPDGDCEDVFCWEVLCDCEDTCPGDLTGDGQVDLSDLLAFLGMYGSICP
jgi:PKD repeat protein